MAEGAPGYESLILHVRVMYRKRTDEMNKPARRLPAAAPIAFQRAKKPQHG